VSREQQLRAAEENQLRSTRIRARFGLGDRSEEESVRDWLLTAGAIPTALALIILVIYVIVSILAGALGP
jgi:hypothetical protein